MSGTYPRLSYDSILALPNPQIGDMAYDTTFLCMRLYNGSKWVCNYQEPNNATPNMTAILTMNSNIDAYDVQTDAVGNVYLSGTFNGTINLGGISKTSSGSFDIFIAKFNNNGNPIWVQTTGGAELESVLKITLDSYNNIYITGYFTGETNIGGVTKTSAGTQDFFVAKCNGNGVFQWLQTSGGLGDDHGRDITLDKSGNVYITGNFSSSFTFGNTLISSTGLEDVYLAKYGIFQWVKTAGGNRSERGIGIEVDSLNNIYVAGYYSGPMNFSGTTITANGIDDIFLASYNSQGNFKSVSNAGGALSDYITGTAIDSEGKVYIIGSYSDNASFGYINVTSSGSSDTFIAKYSPVVGAGGYWEWVRSMGDTYVDISLGINTDALNNI